MNTNFTKLFELIQREERLIIGLMSGTSLDGLDVALCRVRGYGIETKVALLQFDTIAYAQEFKSALREVFCKRNVDLELVTKLNAEIANVHAEAVNQSLAAWGVSKDEIAVIASHGQTIYHAPKNLHPDDHYPNATLQIGDADHLSVRTGIITVSDFRQKHVAKGGEGAPLAVYGDYLLLSSEEENRVLLNLGGIANFTFLPSDRNAEKVFATDVGPANTLIDSAVQKYFGLDYDESGMIAYSGSLNSELLKELKNHPYFDSPFPKSTGQEVFNEEYVEHCLQASGEEAISDRDLIATLTQLTVDSVVSAIQSTLGGYSQLSLYVSGGGSKNSYIMRGLQTRLPGLKVGTTEALGILPEAKEAALFAVLANEMLANEPMKIGKNEPVLMGKLSFPL